MIDASLIFDGTLNPTAGVAITATRVSTNVLDFLVARDLGAGAILGTSVHVLETFATLTSLQVELQVSADNSTFYGLQLSEVIPAAQLIANTGIFRFDWPLNQVLNAAAGILKAPGRYARLNYIVAGSNATAGKVFSYLHPATDRNAYYSYPSNYTVAITAGEI